MEIATFSKKLVRKKVLIPAIIGVGILLSAAFVLVSPLESSWAQQLQQQQQLGMNKTVAASEYGAIPKINGSINVREGLRNFFTENAKTPFITAAQTAQNQIANGTVLGGHIGVTQGYLTYTYFVANPTNDTSTYGDRRCWKWSCSIYIRRQTNGIVGSANVWTIWIWTRRS
jgi:hypothetical protein